MKSNCDNGVYIDRLKKEWENYPQSLKIKNIFIGGGTPNFLSPKELELLLSLFNTQEIDNITIELDPRYLTKDDILAYQKLGITRLSIGIQDFNSKVVGALNREQSIDEILNHLRFIQDLNCFSINLDFIYGLPNQNQEEFISHLKYLKEIKIDTVSIYPFAKVPWQNNFQKAMGVSTQPDLQSLNEFFINIHDYLEEIGYTHISMGLFSNENVSYQRNIMGFIPSKSDSIIGLGVSAISVSPIGMIQNEKIYDRYLSLIKDSGFAFLKGHKKSIEENEREKFFECLILNNYFDEKSLEKFLCCSDELFQNLRETIGIEKKFDQYIISKHQRIFHKTILQHFDPTFRP
jgi:coproporphyrinogen III oxidase-like Fe-S oxidoreductase